MTQDHAYEVGVDLVSKPDETKVVGVVDNDLLDEFVTLFETVRNHGNTRKQYGVGTKEEAYAFSLSQRSALTIERMLHSDG